MGTTGPGRGGGVGREVSEFGPGLLHRLHDRGIAAWHAYTDRGPCER